MVEKIEELSKDNKRVSLHCVSVDDYKKLNVVDISYYNLKKKELIKTLSEESDVKIILHDDSTIKNGGVIKYLNNETCVHVEIKQ